MKFVFPWTDAAGNLLNDHELRIASKNWDPGIWEAYLETQEHVDSEQVSFLEDSPKIKNNVTEDFRVLLTDPNPLRPALVKEVLSAVEKLSPRKKGIILDSYWNEVSERAQAEVSSVQRSSIYRQKRIAKKQLKNILLRESRHLAKWKGKK